MPAIDFGALAEARCSCMSSFDGEGDGNCPVHREAAPSATDLRELIDVIADRLGEHPKAHNEFDPSDEPVTCITLKGVPVEVLAEFIAPAVAALAVPATGEVEWATELRVEGVTEHRFPANSEADARATAAERGEVVVSRTATGWEVTP